MLSSDIRRRRRGRRTERRGEEIWGSVMVGYMWRVRLSSFLVGAATASVTGLCLLYRDYVVAHDSISNQLKGISETFIEQQEALDRRIMALEKRQNADASKPVESD